MKGLICLCVLSLVATSLASEDSELQGKFAPYPYKPIFRHSAGNKVARGRFLPESFRPGGRPMGMSQWADMGFGQGEAPAAQEGNLWFRR